MRKPNRSDALSALVGGISINLLSSLLAFGVAALVTYFEHRGSTWVRPLLYGALAWLLTFAGLTLARLSRLVPGQVTVITHDNIEHFIREWLDRYNLTVKRTNTPEDHFHFLITTTGDKKIVVKCRKGFSEYLTFTGLITFTDEQKHAISALSEDDKMRALSNIRLEVARAVIGMTPLTVENGFSLFKEVPITRSLTESGFISALWQIEAAINSVLAVNLLTEIQLKSEGKLATEDDNESISKALIKN